MFGKKEEINLSESVAAAQRGLLQVLEMYENDIVTFSELHIIPQKPSRVSYGSLLAVETRAVEFSGKYFGRVSGWSRFEPVVFAVERRWEGNRSGFWHPAGEGKLHKRNYSGFDQDIYWRWLDPGMLINPVRVSPSFDAEAATGCHLGDRTTSQWVGSVVHGEYTPSNCTPAAAA